MRTVGRIVSTVAIVAFLATIACAAESPHYVFVLPDGYVGWIQVIFDSPRAPMVVPKHGRFVLRVDKSGVLKTSSTEYVFAGSHDEFFYSRLEPKAKRSCPQYRRTATAVKIQESIRATAVTAQCQMASLLDGRI
jgi:hypothetical protein